MIVPESVIVSVAPAAMVELESVATSSVAVIVCPSTIGIHRVVLRVCLRSKTDTTAVPPRTLAMSVLIGGKSMPTATFSPGSAAHAACTCC